MPVRSSSSCEKHVLPRPIFQAKRGDERRETSDWSATELEFLHALPVALMWGVGPATQADRAVDAIRKRFGAHAVDYGLASRDARSVPDEFRRLAEREL